MTTWTIFASGSPGSPNIDDGTAYTLATGWRINQPGSFWCVGVEWFTPTVLPAGDVIVGLFARVDDSTSGGLLASKTVPAASLTPGARNTILFDPGDGVAVSQADVNGFYAAVYTSSRYTSTGGHFGADDVNGPITAWTNGTVGANGRFFVGGVALTYPTGAFGAAGYWVSPVVTDEDPSGTTDLDVGDLGPRGARAGGSVALVEADHVVGDASSGLQAGGSPAAVVADHVVSDGGPRGARAGGSPAEVAAGTADVTVVDRSTGALAGGSGATVTAAGPSVPDQAVWPMLVDVLACLDAAADQVEAPPLYRSIRMGEGLQANISPTEDECCQGLAWVRPVQISPSNTFPTPESAWSPCPPGELAVEVEIGMLRCAPIMAPGGDDAMLIPTAAQHAQTAYRVLADAAALRRAACCLIDRGYSVFIGSWSPLPIEANCAGGSMRITVAVPFCERTC